MHYTFTKELIEDHYRAGYGRLEHCAMYTVYDGDEKVGAFFYSDGVSWFAFDEEDLRIDYIKKLFRKTRYQIVDQKTGAVIGGYDNVKYISGFKEHGELSLFEEIFFSSRLDPGVKTSFWKSSSIEYFKISVGNLKQQVMYTFQMQPISSSWRGFYLGNSLCEGSIEYQGNSNLLLMAGLFLVEKTLEAENNESSG